MSLTSVLFNYSCFLALIFMYYIQHCFICCPSHFTVPEDAGTELRTVTIPIRPKARGLAQHGVPPGWLEESDPTGVILYVMDGPHRLSFSYRKGCPDRSCPAASCWNFQLMLYSKCTQPSVVSYARKAWPGTLVEPMPMPSLWLRLWHWQAVRSSSRQNFSNLYNSHSSTLNIHLPYHLRYRRYGVVNRPACGVLIRSAHIRSMGRKDSCTFRRREWESSDTSGHLPVLSPPFHWLTRSAAGFSLAEGQRDRKLWLATRPQSPSPPPHPPGVTLLYI